MAHSSLHMSHQQPRVPPDSIANKGATCRVLQTTGCCSLREASCGGNVCVPRSSCSARGRLFRESSWFPHRGGSRMKCRDDRCMRSSWKGGRPGLQHAWQPGGVCWESRLRAAGWREGPAWETGSTTLGQVGGDQTQGRKTHRNHLVPWFVKLKTQSQALAQTC